MTRTAERTESELAAEIAEYEHDASIRHLRLNGVQFNEKTFLGEGAFGVVYRAVYGGVSCAIKQQDFDHDSNYVTVYTIKDFQQECLLHGKLHHPNIVKMYGVCYHGDRPDQPMKVMEFVDGGTLSSLLSNHHTIPIYVKLSILQDVSRGLHYLHTHNPPIIHFNITPSIVMLTSTLTAKIASFTYAQEVIGSYLQNISVSYQTEPLVPVAYGLPFDVFLLGCVICKVVTQNKGLDSLYEHVADLNTGKSFIVYNYKRHQQYLDIMSKYPLEQLTIRCLDDNPSKRPSISYVCTEIDQMLKGELPGVEI